MRCRVVSSLSVNIMSSRFLGFDVVLGQLCLLIVFLLISELVYGSFHLFTEWVCRDSVWIDQLFPGFNCDCWCIGMTMWGVGAWSFYYRRAQLCGLMALWNFLAGSWLDGPNFPNGLGLIRRCGNILHRTTTWSLLAIMSDCSNL